MPVDEIVAKDEGGAPRAPEGQYSAVCVDVIDLGMHENKTFQKVQHKIALVFQLSEIDPATNKRYEIAERFTLSMNEKAQLRKFLGQWRGKSYTDEEAARGVPLHKLAGQPAVVQIEHKANNGKTYANIVSIMRPAAGMTPMKPEGYVRSEGWKKAIQPEPAHAGGGNGAPPVSSGGDDEPPF